MWGSEISCDKLSSLLFVVMLTGKKNKNEESHCI